MAAEPERGAARATAPHRTLAELLGHPELATRRLRGPAAGVLPALADFEHAVAETGTAVALLSQAGRYGSATVCGDPIEVSDDRITLRIDPARVTTAVAYEAALTAGPGDHVGDGAGAALQLLTPDGAPAHCVRLHGAADRLALDRFTVVDGRVPHDTARPTPSVRPPSAAERAAVWPYRRWQVLLDGGPDQVAHLDALLTGAAPTPGRAVDASVLPLVFDHLCVEGLPIGVAVCASRALQAACGPVSVSTRAGDRMRVLLGGAVLELDPEAVVHAAAVTTHGPHGATAALELRDAQQRCLLVLGEFGLVGERVHGAWQRLVAALPDA